MCAVSCREWEVNHAGSAEVTGTAWLRALPRLVAPCRSAGAGTGTALQGLCLLPAAFPCTPAFVTGWALGAKGGASAGGCALAQPQPAAQLGDPVWLGQVTEPCQHGSIGRSMGWQLHSWAPCPLCVTASAG